MVNLVLGDAEVGDALTGHRGVDKVSFTGSTAVGRRCCTAPPSRTSSRVTLELGGKSPNIVFADLPDLDVRRRALVQP